MEFWRITILALAAFISVDAKWLQHQKRETTANLCDPAFNNTNSIQCYCNVDTHAPQKVRTANCHLVKNNVEFDDSSWDGFKSLKDVNKLTLSNNRGIVLTYIPTNALKLLPSLLKLEVKYGNIEKIDAFAFANITVIEEVTLSDNQISVLAVNAFAHHRDLTSIGLDTNNIVEINRNVFIDLPSLEKLFLTNNKITTIHDRAFVHLINLRELEIDRNSIFSLNSETFAGLKKLQRLDLSGNSLEVIGDNTFLPLTNLKTLNLEENKIQMLDEKAFHGLGQLNALILGHNKLTNIDNVKTFEGLESLMLLSLKSNHLVELKKQVMKPILSNFYGNASGFDVEDNNFPCDCRLEWFMEFMNKTENRHLRTAIENLKCLPDANVKELWAKIVETDKTGGQGVEEEESPAPNNDYEYYDETQLNGKLFYIDVRDLINCTNSSRNAMPSNSAGSTQQVSEANSKITTKAISSPTTQQPKPADAKSPKPIVVSTKFAEKKEDNSNLENEAKNKDSYTTVRLATVSAKPLEHQIYDQDMASDEARPEKIKAHRSVQDNKDTPPSNYSNSAHINENNLALVAIILCFRLYFN